MISLFMLNDEIRRKTTIPSQFDYIKSRMQTELTSVEEYYRDAGGKVSNDHFIVRLIKAMLVDYNKPIWDYVLSIDVHLNHILKQFDIVNPYSKGDIHDSVILGENSKEIIIGIDDVSNFEGLENTWQTLKPLRVVYTPSTDLYFRRPDKRLNFDLPSLSIFSIDVKILMVQFKHWATYRRDMDKSLDPAVFVYQYVLTNAISDMVDLAYLNVLGTAIYGIEADEGKNVHPFGVINMRDRIDRVNETIVKNISKLNAPYEEILANIPLVIKSDIVDQMRLVPINTTRQASWATWLCEIPYLMLITNLSSNRTITRNKNYITALRIQMKSLERNRVMDQFENVLSETNYEIDKSTIESYTL